MKAFQRRSIGQGRPLGPDVARGFGVACGLQWACGLSLAVGLMATAHASGAPQVPEGLTGAEWSGIQAQISETRDAMAYEATRRGDDWVATNPAHGFSIRYAEKGRTELELTGGDAKPHQIALTPKSVGYAGGEALSLIEPVAREAAGETVTTQWSSELSEWWVNSDKGLEQWFELTERPKASTDPNAPLVVNLELDSTLQANLRGEGSQQFLHLSGPETSVHFEKLKVFDANGGNVPATLRLNGKVLSYVIDDRQADYPLTIDPTFTQQQRLDLGADGVGPPEGAGCCGDFFGSDVAISDDVLVVGAMYEGSTVADSGAAYVFRQENGEWDQKAVLKASTPIGNSLFGQAVAVSGNTVVVGARGGNTDTAYVFVCDFTAEPSVCNQQAELTPVPDAGTIDGENANVGGVVTIDGDTIALSASLFDDPDVASQSQHGAAFIFERSNQTWTQSTHLRTPDLDGDSLGFGFTVSLSGNTLLVGFPAADKAYVYVKENSTWTEQAVLVNPDPGDLGEFGRDAFIDGNTAVVGAPDLGAEGAAYVFVREDSTWSLQDTLTATDPAAAVSFGRDVSVSGDTVVVGADSNSAYLFTRDDGTWSQANAFQADDTEADDGFGGTVAVSGSTLLIGASRADRTGALGGAAYVFSPGSAGDSEELSAINDFASGDSTTDPTPTTYTDAGVTGVDEDNLEAVNAFVTARAGLLEDDATLSTADIQALVSVYAAIEAAQADPDTMATLTQSDFASLGVELSSELVADVLQGVVSNITQGTDTPEGMEALADVAERIATTIDGGTPTTPLTAGDFNSVGFTSVSNDNLPFVLTRLADSDPSTFAEDNGDSYAALQTVITQGQSDYAAIPKPVPSLSWWAMMLLGGVLGWGMLMNRRRLA